MAQSAEPGRIPNAVKFAFGGLAGMGATCFVQPLDLVKTRMQVTIGNQHKTSGHLIRHIIKTEGATALYTGISAALLRQATYTTTRLGIYTWLFEKASGPKGQPPNFLTKAALGMSAGCVAGFVCNPTEVTLIRMTSDGRLPVAERRNYKNVIDAFVRIVSEEGLLTLWRGAIPTMGRAMVVNGAQLASYSQAKQGLLSTGYFSENILLHFCASMISGLVTTIASMPVDMAKTRIQNMNITDGKPEYSGTVDVLRRVVKKEGVVALWKGFTPYYMKLGPHTVITFIFLEQMNKSYRTHVLGEENAKGGGI